MGLPAFEVDRLEMLFRDMREQLRREILAEINERLDGLEKEAQGVRDFRRSMRWLAGMDSEP